MVKTAVLAIDIDASLAIRTDPIVALAKVAAPFTTVVNRALMTDMSADLQPRFGINRIMTQQIIEVQGEFGPNGERVFKPINDIHDQVRLVGVWSTFNNNNGLFINSSGSTANYCEITFYGTGLNILISDASSRDIRVSVDGGSESASIIPTPGSSILSTRNYSSNVVISAASNLTLGTHTLKLRDNIGNAPLCGFEVLNTNSTLQLPPGTGYLGGKRLYKAALSTDPYASNFESGVLGTRGGHVVVYQKSDGTIGKAVRPTDAASAFLSSASHANEEIIRIYHWREFGAGRNTGNAGQANDDFSSVVAASTTRAFTLDDGTTTLVGSLVGSTGLSPETLGMYAAAGFFTFTFVGTGLDFIRVDSNVTLDQYTVSVDGTSVGTFTGTGVTTYRVQKIVSGLPYGTHTVKMTRDAFVNAAVLVTQFIVYGPSKPSIPAGAMELSDYYLMADYAVSTSSAINFIAPGVLRKFCTREFVYSGTWTSTAVTVDAGNFDGGWEFDTATATSFFQHVSIGTGFEFRGFIGSTHVLNATFTVDGLALNTGSNVGSVVSLIATGITGLSLSAAGVLTGTATGSGEVIIRVSGLAFGVHTFKYLQNGASASPRVVALDIITPVHSQKSNQPGDVQNTLPIGSVALSDNRKFSSVTVKTLANWAQAVGVTSSPTTTVSTANVPVPDMSLTIKTSGNPLQISFDAVAANNTINATVDFLIYVDGVAYTQTQREAMANGAAGGQRQTLGSTFILPVAAGVHKVDVYWSVSAGTGTAVGAFRTLVAKEL